jgi:hypothetical protein
MKHKKVKAFYDGSVKSHQVRHTGEGRYPELIDFTGFRVALRLHGMTKLIVFRLFTRPSMLMHM